VTRSARGSNASGPPRVCRACIHFDNDPRRIEAEFPGLTALGSAYGSSRAEDGICDLRELFLSANGWCDRFSPRR